MLVLGQAVAGHVDPTSSPGRTLIGARVAVGIALFITGVWLRRAPAKPAPDTPKVFDRLANVGAGTAFIGGVLIADYQGSMLAAAALATSDVTKSQQFIGWAIYCLFATGIPVVAALATMHSARAEASLHRTIDWVLRNRRPIASWFCLLAGLALFGDGLVDYVKLG